MLIALRLYKTKTIKQTTTRRNTLTTSEGKCSSNITCPVVPSTIPGSRAEIGMDRRIDGEGGALGIGVGVAGREGIGMEVDVAEEIGEGMEVDVAEGGAMRVDVDVAEGEGGMELAEGEGRWEAIGVEVDERESGRGKGDGSEYSLEGQTKLSPGKAGSILKVTKFKAFEEGYSMKGQ